MQFGLPAPQLDAVANVSWPASSSSPSVTCGSRVPTPKRLHMNNAKHQHMDSQGYREHADI